MCACKYAVFVKWIAMSSGHSVLFEALQFSFSFCVIDTVMLRKPSYWRLTDFDDLSLKKLGDLKFMCNM
jgi:hypothetical protein